MPYDPIRDAQGFRATLRRLSDIERLTSQAIVDLFNKQKTRGDNLSISRATLDRFVQGEHITKIRELRVIHELLESHPAYGRYFAQVEAMPPAGQGMAFGEALGAFFAGDSGERDLVRLDDARIGLPGQFVLMRRDHDRVSLDKGVRVSSLSMVAEDGGVSVHETQSYRTPDGDMPFEQTDRGHLFVHGPMIYFLLKEIGGTAVKFGVIDQTLPELDRRQPVQYFQGYLMVVSRRGVFPRARFAARRFNPAQHAMTSGITRLCDIADPRAVEHLREDFTSDGAARPA